MSGTADTATFEHIVECNMDDAWKILFTKDFDPFYLKEGNLGTCNETKYEEKNGVIYRSAKIIPNLGESTLAVKFKRSIQWYYQVNEISYVTVQEKNINKVDGEYVMKFENTEYSPNVETLKSIGTVKLCPHQTDNNKSILKTEVHVNTQFPWGLVGAHTIFMQILKVATNDAFTKMTSALPKYKSEK